jgi:hypothetical protein
MRINYTRPGRLHLIRSADGWYVTLILFGRRYHFTSGPAGLPDRSLWS